MNNKDEDDQRHYKFKSASARILANNNDKVKKIILCYKDNKYNCDVINEKERDRHIDIEIQSMDRHSNKHITELSEDYSGREVKSVLRERDEFRHSKAKNKLINLDSKGRVEYLENTVSVLNTMFLKSGQEISDILDIERKRSAIFLQNVLESRANSIIVSEKNEEHFCTKYEAGNSDSENDEIYYNSFESGETSKDINESVNRKNTDNVNACRCIEDRFKEYKIVYECIDDVDNRARGLAALQRLYSADVDRNWI